MKTTDANYAAYHEEMLKVWGSNTHMIDYCEKKTIKVVKLNDGRIVDFEQPSIDTNFCFGYRSAVTDDYDEAQAMASHASKSVGYFIDKNMQGAGYDEALEKLRDPGYVILGGVHYTHGENLYFLTYARDNSYDMDRVQSLFNGRLERIDESNRQLLIEANEELKAKFRKRLDSYIKRYGMSKVRTWTYWSEE